MEGRLGMFLLPSQGFLKHPLQDCARFNKGEPGCGSNAARTASMGAVFDADQAVPVARGWKCRSSSSVKGRFFMNIQAQKADLGDESFDGRNACVNIPLPERRRVALDVGKPRSSRIGSLLAAFWLPWFSFLLLVPLTLLHSGQSAALQLGRFLSGIGNDVFIGISVLLLVVWGHRSLGKSALWWWLDIILCTTLCVHVLKVTTALPRPSGSPSGFPSGHCAFAFALAWLVLVMRPRLAPLWFAIAIAIGWSRAEVGAHHPYQVVAGATLGLGLGCWVSRQRGGVLVPRCFVWKRTALTVKVRS